MGPLDICLLIISTEGKAVGLYDDTRPKLREHGLSRASKSPFATEFQKTRITPHLREGEKTR